MRLPYEHRIIKPVALDWTAQMDPFIDSDWNPIIEEWYYTAEVG